MYQLKSGVIDLWDPCAGMPQASPSEEKENKAKLASRMPSMAWRPRRPLQPKMPHRVWSFGLNLDQSQRRFRFWLGERIFLLWRYIIHCIQYLLSTLR